MSEGHEEQADRLEQELEDMQERHDRVEGDIEASRKDWAAKKADPGVPGASPDPSDGDDGDGASELIDPRDEGE
jgi:hypothetical protein